MSEEKSKTGLAGLFRRTVLSVDVVLKVLLVLAMTILLAVMFPRGEAIELDYKVGAVWAQKDLIAPFSFPVFRDERGYAEEVAQAKSQAYPVFERDETLPQTMESGIFDFFDELDDVLHQYRLFRRSADQHLSSMRDDSASFAAKATQLAVRFSPGQWAILESLAGVNRLDVMREKLNDLIKRYSDVGFIEKRKSEFSSSEIAIRKGTIEEIVPLGRVYDHQDIVALLEKDLASAYGRMDDVAEIAFKIGITHIAPNLKFNPQATELAANARAEAVPRTEGFVQENERIVSKHERITQDTKLKLESLRRVRAERGIQADRPVQFLGIILHVAIVVMLYGIYLYLFRKRIFGSNRKLALIGLLILMEGFFAYVTRELNVNAPIEYLILLPAASMLLTISFDSRVAFYGTVVMAFLVAGIRGNDYSIALASLIAGALSVYTVRDMKHRTQIFRSLGFIFLGYTLSIIALALERFDPVNVVVEQLIFALANAIVSPVLTYGLLIFFERVFRITTDLTLIELSHFNHPLLRKLSEQAPGTYHHSMTMASLAETAAVAVGANEVLARVGAFFHDVGKIVKPTYFVENQKGNRNRHEKLAPRMSSLIISAHVKDGIALAREHNLPEEVVDFIPMHHGTTRIEYFYDKALKQAESSPDESKVEEINEQDYRYPGPKPQTKETGILMLADAIEARARTLDDPSHQKLEAMIDEIFRKRFEEGELDECPLTLKDLTKIKTAFLNVLVGIYHTRVKYPGARDGATPASAQTERPAPARLARTIKEIDGQ